MLMSGHKLTLQPQYLVSLENKHSDALVWDPKCAEGLKTIRLSGILNNPFRPPERMAIKIFFLSQHRHIFVLPVPIDAEDLILIADKSMLE